MKSPSFFGRGHSIVWPVLATLHLLPMGVRAEPLPTGAIVTAGSAQVGQPSATSLQVTQRSQRAVINWTTFNVANNHSVSFVQPNAAAATLNIVTGDEASLIAGSVTANGSVLLINQHGIAITPTGLVDTRSGFIASTLGMREADFMNGTLRFEGNGAGVANQGTILTGEGGAVALIGASARNDGVIRAPLGKVALGSGSAATLDLNGDGFLQVTLAATATSADGKALVSNSGLIAADGGLVELRASTVRAAMRDAVNMPGTIQARSISGRNGAVLLDSGAGTVQVSGAIDVAGSASGADGGRIDITGNQVALTGARLDASGTQRGGAVRIGGAFQGGRAQLPGSAQALAWRLPNGAAAALANASSTAIDADSNIDISATAGSGGSLVVWSDLRTDMQGSVAAHGPTSGGAVEVSSASLVHSVKLGRIDLGPGGNLLLDPQDILIDANAGTGPVTDTGYEDHPGAVTHLLDSDVIGVLNSGANLHLKASQDINWVDNFTFAERSGTRAAGDLALTAGRSVTLSGAFTSGDGSWRITANDSAANGVVDAERGDGVATIDLHNAGFIGGAGSLSVTLGNGAGNTYSMADRIMLGTVSGHDLTSTIAPNIVTPNDNPKLVLFGDINIAGAFNFNGDLQVVPNSGSLTLNAHTINWADEKTGAHLSGEGQVAFIENGVTTRLGSAGYSDAVRLTLADNTVAGLSRIYGDADPTLAASGIAPLRLAPYSENTTATDLDNILAPGSLALVGPGVHAAVGAQSLALRPTANVAFANPISGSYLIDLTPVAIPLAITARPLGVQAASATTTYGTGAALVTLSNLANGDLLAPVASFGAQTGLTMSAEAGAFGFGDRIHAGSSGYTVTGLAGSSAGNYSFDPQAQLSGTVTVAPKALTFAMGQASGKIYSNAFIAPGASLSGVLFGDDVSGVAGLYKDGAPILDSARLPVGAYTVGVANLRGSAAPDYVLASSGNAAATYTVSPLTLPINGPIAYSTYGELPVLAEPYNVVPGDQIEASITVSANGVPVTPSAKTPVAVYSTAVTGISGADAANYHFVPGRAGTWRIAPRVLGFSGSASSQEYGQEYGQNRLPAPALTGVLAGDEVFGYAASVDENGVKGGVFGRFVVGNYRVRPVELGGRDGANYALGDGVPNTVAVTPKLLSLWADPLSIVYGNVPQLPFISLLGTVGNDAVSPIAFKTGGPSLDPKAPRLRVGQYTMGLQVELSGPASANYRVEQGGTLKVPLTVTTRPLAWTAPAELTSIYGESLGAAVLLDVLAGDSLSASLGALNADGAALVRPDAGYHVVEAINLSGAQAANYTLNGSAERTKYALVTPRPLQVLQVTPTSNVYGTQPSFGSVFLDNVLPGDDAGALQRLRTGRPLTPKLAAGTHATQVYAFSNPNYMWSPLPSLAVDGVITVAPLPLQFSTADSTMVYGGATHYADGVLTSAPLAGDDVRVGTGMPVGVPALARADAGVHALVPTLTGRDAGNYTLDMAQSHIGQLTVTPRPAWYTIELSTPDAKLYWSDANPQQLLFRADYGDLQQVVATPHFNNLVDDDSLQLAFRAPDIALSSSKNIAAGTYNWVPLSVSGTKLSNYVVSGTESALTISPAPLAITPGIQRPNGSNSPMTTTYSADTLNAVATAVSGIKTGGAGGVADDVRASVGIEQGSFVQSRLSRLAVGAYPLAARLGGKDAANYTPFLESASFVVEPKLVTIQVPDFYATYGETARLDLDRPTISGLVAGDRLDVDYGFIVSLQTGRSAVPAARTPAGQYQVYPTGLSGESAGNYTFSGYGAPLSVRSPDLPATTLGTLTIDPRPLNPSVDPAGLNLVYGSYVPQLKRAKVLDGDDVTFTGLAIKSEPGSGQKVVTLAADTLVDAGAYSYTAKLSGADAANYTLTTVTHGANAYQVEYPIFGTILMQQRPLTATVQDRATGYGDVAASLNTLDRLVPGQDVTRTVTVVDAVGIPVNYTAYTDAGLYRTSVTAISGPAAHNYTLAGSNTAALTITPRQLSWDAASAPTAAYGSAVMLGTLRGTLLNDDVGIKTASSDALGPVVLANDGSGALRFNGKRDVGTYLYSFGATDNLVGTRSANYRLPAGARGSFSLTPRELIYAVDNASGSYGNFKECNKSCDPWVPGIALGKVQFKARVGGQQVEGIVAGDELGADIGLLDFNGVAGALDARTPVGRYFEVLTGLTGKSAGNYRIAPSGSAPGILTIAPMWLTYAVSNAVFVDGIGLVGNLGVATLRGPNGTPINGDDVTPVVAAFTLTEGGGYRYARDLTHLAQGRYYFLGVGLEGKDAANYRLAYQGGEGDSYMRDGIHNAGPFGNSEPGTLDVFAGSSLGMGLLGAAELPVVPKVGAPQVTYQPLTMPKLSNFGRNIDVSGATASSDATTANAGASGATITSTAVGQATISAQASGSTQALAKVGISGINVVASAGGHTDVMVTVGPGFVTYGLQGDVLAQAKLGPTGLTVSAEALAQMDLKGGASGSLGAGGTGNASATAVTFAFAKATNEYGLKDGAIVLTSKDAFGVGASIGATGGISGSVGSAQIGATVYSPGSFGGTFSATAGYAGGKVAVGFNLGAQLGLGGLDININLSIDVGTLTTGVAYVGEKIGKAIGYDPFGKVNDVDGPFDFVNQSNNMASDPVGRYAYLMAHPSWVNGGSSQDFYHTFANTRDFFNDYTLMIQGVHQLVIDEAATRAKFLGLLKSDPAAAIAFSRSTNFANEALKRENALLSQAGKLGVTLVVANGKLTFKSPK